MRTGHRAELGRAGEDLAVRLLEDEGLLVLDRNWRDGRRGELDIVAWDEGGDALVFVEVRTRTGVARGTALESVDARKLARLRRLAAAWLACHDVHARVRLDVVAVTVQAPRTQARSRPRPQPPAVALPLDGARVEWVQGVSA